MKTITPVYKALFYYLGEVYEWFLNKLLLCFRSAVAQFRNLTKLKVKHDKSHENPANPSLPTNSSPTVLL